MTAPNTPTQQGTSSTGGNLGGTPLAPGGAGGATTALNNQRQNAQFPTLNPPPMKTLVYAPDVTIQVVHNGQQYDVSKDIVRGQVVRKENSASSLFWTSANPDLRYNGLFSRMDRVTVYLTRVQKLQVFSGYLDTIPWRQAYPGTVDFRATCTIKRLLHTWWNPGSAASAAFFDQIGASLGTAGDGQANDSGIGSILRNILEQVGKWAPNTIHIQNFPQEFLTFLNNYFVQTNMQAQNAQTAQQFTQLITGDDTSPGPMGAVGYSASDPVGTAATATNANAAFYLQQIVAATDERGMGPIVDSTANSQQVTQAATTAQDAQTSNHDYSLQQGVNQMGQQLGQYASNWSTQNKASDAAIWALACAMVESGGGSPNLQMLANNSDPPTLTFYHSGLSTNGSSSGLFQQQNNGAWGCLPACAQIFTSHGPVPIIDVKEGDEVWSFDGARMALCKVTAWMMTGHQPLVTVRTAGRELQATAGHRVPVRRYFGLVDGRSPGNCGWETIEMGAGEIRPGDYLIVPHGMMDGTACTTPDGDELSVGLMELIGLYLGDGNLDKGRIEISHGTGGIYNDHMHYYRTVIEQELHVTPYVDKRRTRTRFSSPEFVKLVREWFPGVAKEKRVPGWVFRLSPTLQLALLRGYLDADGSVDKLGRASYCSTSKGLLEDIKHLCILIGVPVGKIGERKGRGGYSGGERTYSLCLSSVHHNPMIGSNSPHKDARFRCTPKQLKSRYDPDWNSSPCRKSPMGMPPEGTVYHRVVSISSSDEKVPVYDLEVAGLHHYVANGVVVHNTPGQRMNPYASAGMFLDKLNAQTGWRNMDPGQAIWQVQQSDTNNIQKYDAAIQQATTLVQAYRQSQQGGTNAASGLANMIPGAGALGGVLGGGSNPLGSITGALGTATTSPISAASGAAATTSGVVPDSEGAINAAYSIVGTPYQFGGNTPGVGIDCSKLVQLSFGAIGFNLQRATSGQRASIPAVVPASSAQRGDILQTEYGGHTGIYLGNNQWIQTGGPTGAPGSVQSINPAVSGGPNGVSWVGRVCANGGQNPSAPFTPITGASGATSQVPGTGIAPGTGTGGSTGGGGGSTTGDEPIARNLFSYMFQPNAYDAAMASFLSGTEKAYIDDQPLIQIVKALAMASLRNFQSSPTGDLIFYYPDPFGMDGKAAILSLYDIELKDAHIDLSDDNLTTHVYIEGDFLMIGQAEGAVGWLQTSGVATVENAQLFQRLQQAAPGDVDSNMSAQQLMSRFGVRPYKDSYQIAGNAGLEFLLACQIFMGKWASQYETDIGLTFMPELFPGMRVNLVGHNLTVYCSAVTHVFDWEHGFSTLATVSAASNPNSASSIYSSLPGFLNPVSTNPRGGGNTSTNGFQPALPGGPLSAPAGTFGSVPGAPGG
jgi:cell wall-associated NlpC family hydrolase